MKVRHMLTGLLVLSLVLPLPAVVYAVDCCYGTTCPTYSDCTGPTRGPTYGHTCKRTCASSGCTQGDGCCEWDKRDCYYGPGPDPTKYCPQTPITEIINVTFSSTRHCRPPGSGNEVGCLETAANTCNI
jgi:hypothetical protein